MLHAISSVMAAWETVAFILLVSWKCIDAGCYFPFEHHGLYAVQRADGGYSEVAVETSRILPYGECHRRIGNNLILRDQSNGCLGCYHMFIRSVNVLQLYTRDPQTSCATQLNDTFSLCPTAEEMSSPRHMTNSGIHEIMMYRVRSSVSEQHVQPVYCPINGRFQFSYTVEDDSRQLSQCSGQLSHMSNCPFGFGLNLHFRGCMFPHNYNITFQCLGNWQDRSNNKYMALLDVDAYEGRPRYRCAMYREIGDTVHVALSADSSCHKRLSSPTVGYERLLLKKLPSPSWPPAVTRTSCQLPSWWRGSWRQVHVRGDTVVYQDARHFRQYTAKCTSRHGDKYVIFSRSQCGDEAYQCLAIRSRGPNVMQFQTGVARSSQYSPSLCDGGQFKEDAWSTQARTDDIRPVSCPVSGEYEGIIPNTNGQLCAKLYSDCNNAGIMFYTVVSCVNASDIYEEREYRCLGTWSERSVLYTYTQRRDALTYECFAGRTLPDGRLFIADAGTGATCHAHVQPATTGMLIKQTAPCYNYADSTEFPSTVPPPAPPPSIRLSGEEQSGLVFTYPASHHPAPSIRTPDSRRSHAVSTQSSVLRTTTRPWRPITAVPGVGNGGCSINSGGLASILLSSALLTLLLHHVNTTLR